MNTATADSDGSSVRIEKPGDEDSFPTNGKSTHFRIKPPKDRIIASDALPDMLAVKAAALFISNYLEVLGHTLIQGMIQINFKKSNDQQRSVVAVSGTITLFEEKERATVLLMLDGLVHQATELGKHIRWGKTDESELEITAQFNLEETPP